MSSTFFLLVGLVLLCILQPVHPCGGGRGRRSSRRPNRPPEFNRNCFTDITESAPPGKTTAKVTWNANKYKASDPDGDTISYQRTSGPGPGSYFSGKVSGGTQVVYKAQDSRGAAAYCSFRVHVTVRYCSTVPSLLYGTRQCSGDDSNVYGSRCKSECYNGYSPSHHADVVCGSNRLWAPAFPTCQPKSCGNPGSIENGRVECDHGHVYPEGCSIVCNSGFGYSGPVPFIQCGQDGRWSSLQTCRDTERPTFPKYCPSDQSLRSGPLDAPVAVTWPDPEVSDNSGRRPVLTSSPARGTRLGPGIHTVTITATDAAGNKESCRFNVEIQSWRCAELQVPSGSSTCSHGSLVGSQCNATCLKGYELRGSGNITCVTAGQGQQWSPKDSACQAVQCPEPQLQNGVFVCANGRTYSKTCSPKCQEGFRYQGSLYIECFANATWSPLGFCKDVEQPKFPQGCPKNINAYAAELGQTTGIKWSHPQVTDNAGAVTLTSDIQPGAIFPVGVTTVTYHATDQAGNKEECSFIVIVNTLVCSQPDLEASSSRKVMIYNCSDGYVYGASCTLNCTYGYPLVGPDTITCKRNDQTYPPTMFWEWAGPSTVKPICQETICPDLEPPQQGALSCHVGNAGWDCLMSCRDPYDVPGSVGTGHFFCPNSKGYWIPDTVPDCSVRRRPNEARVQGDLFYYANSCNVSKDELRQKFITRMSNDPFLQDACVGVPSCIVQNVQVHCGSRRSKRDTDSSGQRLWREVAHHLYRRQSANSAYYVEINYEIPIILSQDASHNSQEEYQMVEGLRSRLYSKMQAAAQNGSFDVAGLYLDPSSGVGAPKVTVRCPSGTVPRQRSDAFSCVGCSQGHFLSASTGKCQACPVGSYSDIDNATVCTPCPTHFSTSSTGATSVSQCKEQCPSGHYSPDGFVPCQPCAAGQFQSRWASTRCVTCPLNTWTVNAGATSERQCIDADLILNNSSLSLNVSRLNGTSVTVFLRVAFPSRNSSLSLSLNSFLNPSLEASTILSAASMVDPVKESKERLFHHFVIVVTSPSVTAVPQNVTVLQLGQQTSQLTTLTLHTEDNDVVVSSLAVSQGILTPQEIQTLAESCPVNMTSNVLIWSPDPSAVRVPSKCDAQDKCSPNPCGSHGSCVYLRGGYECQCQGGWSGSHCQAPPTPCNQHQCKNGATCVPAGNSYSCTCTPRYTGVFCESEKVDGGWTEWQAWSSCACGTVQRRQRLCANPSPHNGGAQCSGSNADVRNCTASVCHSDEDGTWGPWKSWSSCPVSCGGGLTTRHRSCVPVNGTGTPICEGSAQENMACNTAACPVHGGWGPWSAVSQCSVTCGQSGVHTRKRKCNAPMPAYGGQSCGGPDSQTLPCGRVPCPECKKLERATGGMWSCKEVSKSPYLKECSFTCLGPYVIVDPPSGPSTCGEATSYLWDHQRKPSGAFSDSLQSPGPSCSRAHPMTDASYEAKMDMNTDCDPSKTSQVTSGILENVNQRVECQSQGLCRTSMTTACKSSRKRSTPKLQIIVKTVLTLNTSATDLQSNGTAWQTYQQMMSVVNQSLPDNSTLQSLLTVKLSNGKSVTPDMSSVISGVTVICPAGMTATDIACAECPAGTKGEDGGCVQCPLGFYQDKPASTSCIPCPAGLSWDLPGATSVQHCVFKRTDLTSTTPSHRPGGPDSDDDSVDVGLLVGLLLGAVALILVVLGIVIYLCWKQAAKGEPARYRPGSRFSLHKIFPMEFNASPPPSAPDSARPMSPEGVLPTYDQALETSAAPQRHTVTTKFME